MAQTAIFVNKNISTATSRLRGYNIYQNLKKNTKFFVIKELYQKKKINLKRIKNFFIFFHILKKTKNIKVFYLVKTVYNIDFLIFIILVKFFTKKKIIFDFDDAIFFKPFTKFNTNIFLKIADVIVVGSSYLYKWVKIKKKNSRVYKLPTAVPYSDYIKVHKLKKGKKIFTIGWIGNGKNDINFENLKILKPIFEELIKKKINFKFKLVGSAGNKDLIYFFKSIKKLNFEYIQHINWRNSLNSAKEIKSFDLGVMPIIKNKITMGKCAYKLLEYMACEIPFVASGIGENNLIVNNNTNGYLANSKKEWVKYIMEAKYNKKKNKKMVKISKNIIKNKYSVEVIAKKFKKIIYDC